MSEDHSALMLIAVEIKEMRKEHVSIKQELYLLRKFLANEVMKRRYEGDSKSN